MFQTEYIEILMFLMMAMLLSFMIFLLSFIMTPQKYDYEKISAYECGFNPFDDARMTFDVRFYLIAILFLMFDLEVIFLFPWVLILNKLSLFGFWMMILFLLILTIGFIYEWKKGALEWE